jgi:motility quorum-sensing regulator/GCU-specific mRNA interferase toxin
MGHYRPALCGKQPPALTSASGFHKLKAMEKRTPHYKLDTLKAALKQRGIDGFTFTARNNAHAMGLNETAALAVVMNLRSGNFYKSMTTHADHRIWQDVYHASCPNGKTAYIKLTLQEGLIVIQFKEK